MYRSEAVYLSKNDAKKAESSKYTEVTTSISNPSVQPILALSDVMIDRLSMILAKKGEKYYKDNKRHFKKLLEHTKNIPVNDVTRDMIETFLSKQAVQMKK